MTDTPPEHEPANAAEPIDTAQMWENLCLADELSEDCRALEQGLAEQLRMAVSPEPK